eukprot:Rhum_TRINITY_DN16636_c0_g1::Rhum_TRINITY_DN16636_c0_g1_i1::g.163921::m.163921
MGFSSLLGKVEKVFGHDLDGNGTVGTADSVKEKVKRAFTDALKEGVETSVMNASRSGGFGDPRIRIPWPQELGGKIESAMQQFLPDYYERFIAKLNEAAERAAHMAKDALLFTLQTLNLERAIDLILSDNQRACTDYFRETAWQQMYQGMRGIVENALGECGVMELWTELTGAYNRIPGPAKMMGDLPETINTDIADYSTNKAISGLLVYVADREAEIRQHPAISQSQDVQQVFEEGFLNQLREEQGM